MKNNRIDDAKILIQKVYHKSENLEEIYDFLTESIGLQDKEEKRVSLYDTMSDPRYRKATWIVVTLLFFNQFTGIDALNVYSNRMITKMNENA